MKNPHPADIAEMKARGFDSTTIAEAEKQLGRWAIAQKICLTIESAFAGVRLGDGVGLREAQGLDDCVSDKTRAAYRAKDEKQDWRRIPAEALRRCNSSLSFFDAEGMRFHLPAYLLADLHGDYGLGLAFCLTYFNHNNMSRFALLSKEQRAVVRAFLLHIAGDPDYELEQAEIVHALKEYWTDEAASQEQ